jgi:hypothetical protein
VAKSSTPAAIIEVVGKKSGKPGPKGPGFFTLTQINEDFTNRGIDCKDFRTDQQSRSKPKQSAMRTLHTLPRRGTT